MVGYEKYAIELVVLMVFVFEISKKMDHKICYFSKFWEVVAPSCKSEISQ